MVKLALLFLRLGVLGFGGPIAAMAMFENEFVVRRKWISERHFSEIYAVLKLCPGPLSTQMAIYLGRRRGGRWGGVVAGISYILPATLMLIFLSMLYVRSGGVGSSTRFLGFQLGALVVIIQSTINMSRPYRGKLKSWLAALGAFALVYPFPRYEPLVLIGFGVIGALLARSSVRGEGVQKTLEIEDALAGESLWSLGVGVLGVAALILAFPGILSEIFLMCFKGGAFVFGSGLAIVPLLEGEAVRHYHWLTHQQFMDGLALGQVTPGPVVVTATFIGFFVASFAGAWVATIGIFLPGFLNVYWILPRVWSKVSKSPYSAPFTAFAIPAVIGAIFATSFRLGAVSLISPVAWGIFIAGLAIAQVPRVPGWALILLSGAVGMILV